MAKPNDILGLNAREKLYRVLNRRSARLLANSKLRTKTVLEKVGVAVPKLYAVFKSMDEVRAFEFEAIETSFVIKPSGGSGGKGIMIIRKPLKNEGVWLGIDGKKLTAADLRLHISDILDGQYSTFGTKHMAFVEERVPVHPKFKRYVYRGTPDFRVLVYNRVPVMAMMRLPTKESEGRANLHQGAIGVGIDISTGVTLKGVRGGKIIRYVPGTKRKLNGLKIPNWTAILKTALEATEEAKLVFGGVDILLHAEKGPMILELNHSPGLDIQLANNAGLRWRLERVEGLKIRDVAHGVRVGKALFAEYFADKVKADEGLTIIENFERVEVRSNDKKRVPVEAMVDTGAYRSSIDETLARELGLVERDNVLWEGSYSSALGKQRRKVVGLTYYMKGKRIKTAVSVANRSKRRTKMLIGRLDLQGFLVNPTSHKR